MDRDNPPILVVEDDPALGRLMRAIFESEGCRVLLATDGSSALRSAQSETPRAVLLDLGLPDMDGLRVLEGLRRAHAGLPVIILTGQTGVSTAVQAIQAGAFNYFTKPFDRAQLVLAVRHALERAALQDQVRALKGQAAPASDLARLMGPGQAVRRLQEQVRQVAATNFTVFVHGETGAGKELVCRAIHDSSPRSAQPYVALDCGAIPETLLESELFGYEKGAFSGADRRKEGRFRLADGGTVFLDEIANLPLGLQAKLLRVLQERQLQPLGGGQPQALDVRVVAASNQDLESEARAGRFRQDLFFRLSEFRISLPALRERPEDIPYLAQRFLEEAAVELRLPVGEILPGALALLKSHPWPGNVRQLRNVVRQAVLQCGGLSLAPETLKPLLGAGPDLPADGPSAPTAGASLREIGEAALAGAERGAIRAALRDSAGNILQAARALRTDNKTLHTKLKKYGIRAKDFEEAAP